MRYRYSRWDGTQDPFGPEVDASDVLEELADDVLMGTRRGERAPTVDAARDAGPVLRPGRAPPPAANMREQEEEALDLARPARGDPRTARGDPGPRAEHAVVQGRGRRADAGDVPGLAPARCARAGPRAPGLPVHGSRGAAAVRRADGASARAGAGRALPEHGRGPEEHDARDARAVPRHARRAEPDDRAAGARRGRTTSTGSWSATATCSRRPEDPGRAAGAHGAPDGGDEPAHGVAQPEQRAELRSSPSR